MGIVKIDLRGTALQLSENIVENALFVDNEGLSTVSLFTKYSPLVKSRALRFLVPGMELDDLIQEGNIGLLFAVRKYDSRVSAFATFARKCIDSAIIDHLRKMRKVSTVPGELLVDINDVEVVDLRSDLEHSVSLKEEYQHFLTKAEEILSAFEHSIFLMMLRGYSPSEIAGMKSVDLKSVRNAVQRIRTKLK